MSKEGTGKRASLGKITLQAAIGWSIALLGMQVHAAQPLGCLIEAERAADIGSQVVGIIDSIPVDRGDLVKQGQTLVVLKAQPERAALGLAKIRQQAEGELRAALAAAKLARQNLTRAEELFRLDFVSSQAVDQARANEEVAQQKLRQARENKRVADGEVGYSQAQLGLRTIVAPFDGVVTERYMVPGERVEEKPIVRIAQIDPLRVQVVVPASLYTRVKVGASARVQPELPDLSAVDAVITSMDKVIDPASNTFRILLRLDNRELTIPAGLRCRAELALPTAQGASDPESTATTGTPTSSAASVRPTLAPTPRPGADRTIALETR